MTELIDAIGPVFVVILIGYGAARTKLLPSNTGTALSRYLFFFSIPFLIFSNIYAAELAEIANFRFLLAYFLTLCSSILIGLVIFGWFFGLRRATLVVQVLGSFYANATYVGVPVCMLALGSAIPPLLILMVQVLFFMPAVSTLLDLLTNGRTGLSFPQTLRIIFTNPMLISGAGALILKAFSIRLPGFITTGVDLLARPAMTVGLFALGFTCYLPSTRGFTRVQVRSAVIAAFMKVFIQPLLAFLIGRYLIGLDPWWARSLTICAGLPCAVNAFVLSQRYDAAENESKLTLIFSTALFSAAITVFLLLF